MSDQTENETASALVEPEPEAAPSPETKPEGGTPEAAAPEPSDPTPQAAEPAEPTPEEVAEADEPAPAAAVAAADAPEVEAPEVKAEEAEPVPPQPSAEDAAAAPEAAAPKEKTAEETARDRTAAMLRQAKEEDRTVEGKVIGWNQGGFHVVIDAVTAFCPRSEMELKNPKSPSFYMDKTFEFKVIKHQKRGRRIVLSRKQVLVGEREGILAGLQSKVGTGEAIEGRISSLTDFGAFVDVGGIEGLVHVTEISHRRVGHPKDLLKVGQPVQVQVLKIEEGGGRISLSMKALEDNPWQRFAESHSRGSTFEGKVVRKTDFGIFVELEPGLDGMIHLSQLPPGKDVSHESLEVGKTISGWVLRTEPDRERISLSLREVPEDDPWKNVRERLPEGSMIEGEVEDVAPFGVFILLEPGLTGLLPNSSMNLPRGQDVGRTFPPGKRVQVLVDSIDPQRKRISLAMEGQRLAGSRQDYKEYVKQQKQQERRGMNAMEAAFAKLRDPDSSSA